MGPYGARSNGVNAVRSSASSRNWNGHNNWNSAGGHWRNSNGKWGWWNGNKWCYPRNNVVFIGGLGFPWWWGWGWGPWAGYGGGYPYGYYGYGDPYYGGYGYPYYGYGNGYGAEYQSQYGNSSQSRVAELQQRLSRAGYYNGSIDGILGPQTRRAIRAYEQQHGDVG
jgi:Putative peptidoglycan binding domain